MRDSREVKMSSPKRKYQEHKYGAKKRGLPFELTFEEWYDIWQKSGKWELRGKGKNAYVMSRIGDKGGYTFGNVFIQTASQNSIDGNKGRNAWNKGIKMSAEHIASMVNSRWNKLTETT